MTLKLSPTAELLSQKTNIQQQIIVELEGIPLIFGSRTVEKFWRVGEDEVTIGQAGLLIGGTIDDTKGRQYISLEGTTNNLTQQLEIDKGGTGSVQKFRVELVDKSDELTRAFEPGVNVDDLLGIEATVYLSFVGASHPENSVRIFSGVVDSTNAGSGRWRLSIAHPESLKRQEIFQKFNGKLDGAISDVQTTLDLESVSGLISPGDDLRSAVRINNEIIEFTGISTNTLTGLIRGSFNTIASGHSGDSDVESFYVLEGQPLDLALKLMLSRKAGENNFKTNVSASRFVQVDPATSITDGIFFDDLTFQDDNGLEIGDLVTITGATNGANNISEIAITGFTTIATGTIVVVGGAGLVIEIDSAALASFRSQFDTLPEGAGLNMSPKQVDVAQHISFKQLFASTEIDYQFFIKDTVVGKEFLSEQVYYPAGYYQVPRKGRASMNKTIPPLVLEELKEFTESNVKTANRIAMDRTINKNFFNAVTYKFNVDSLEPKFLTGQVILSERSVNRIAVGTKSLVVEAQGIRDDGVSRNFIEIQARRFSDRYQFAAESVKVKTNYKVGFNAEIADVVLFGTPNLKVVDQDQGNREFRPRLMEVTNKAMNIKTGDLTFQLLDTGFGIDGNYGVVSPSSFIDAGSTTTNIKLKRSFTTGEFALERDKWINFVGEEIEIRNSDFTFREVTTLISFDSDSLSGLNVSPALSVAPSEDYLVDLPQYPTSDNPVERSKMKTIHVFWTTRITIVSGISTTVFSVAPADIASFKVGDLVRVHSDDFTRDSNISTIDDDAEITFVDTGLNRVTVNRSLTFIPLAGDLVDLIGFPDDGLPFRLIS